MRLVINDTANAALAAAMDRQSAGGGLGEYYSESDTRVPAWVVAGDTAAVGELTGLDAAALHGGFADSAVAARWLDDGITPNEARGRVFTAGSVHGFDLTFGAPKSVSLLRALTDDVGEKTMLAAHHKGIDAAMTYLHQHAGYTRVHHPLTGNKDLRRLPGLVGIAYQHETSRCGDPHLHTHVIVPNRQARADGTLVSIDSKSLYHEAKAAGVIYQAVVRHELHETVGAEWAAIDGHTGMAEIAGAAAISRLVAHVAARMCQPYATRKSPAASRCWAIRAALSSAAAGSRDSIAAATRRCSSARSDLS
jgi:conjugative relaxase-like TrwC/TraI family protein